MTQIAHKQRGKLIEDGVHVFIHPDIYDFIDGLYTFIPHAFLTLDARRHPHAIQLYSYIAYQWRIGWHQYEGVIKQPLKQILDGAGLLVGLPKRKSSVRKYVERIKKNLNWLAEQDEFWIGSIRFESCGRSPLDITVIITMAEGHPLKSKMKGGKIGPRYRHTKERDGPAMIQ